VLRPCRQIVPHTNNSTTEELLTNVDLVTLNKKFATVTTCCRHRHTFKHTAPLVIYLAKQYLIQIDQVKSLFRTRMQALFLVSYPQPPEPAGFSPQATRHNMTYTLVFNSIPINIRNPHLSTQFKVCLIYFMVGPIQSMGRQTHAGV